MLTFIFSQSIESERVLYFAYAAWGYGPRIEAALTPNSLERIYLLEPIPKNRKKAMENLSWTFHPSRYN